MAEVIQDISGVILFLFLYVRQARVHKAALKAAKRQVQAALWQDRQIRKGSVPNVGGVNGSNSGR